MTNQYVVGAGAAGHSDAAWLRQALRERGSLNEVARMQSDLWMGLASPPA